MTLYMRVNLGNIRYFGLRGILEEMVERQGKGDQNVCNQPIEPPLGPWVHSSSCYEENHFSKLKKSQNDHFLT